MKIIKDLSEMIEDELEGALNYVKSALHYKTDNPSLANVLYEISTQEMHHVNILHDEVVKVIKRHRESNGDPPPAMAAIYEWEHNRQIEKTKEIKVMQSQFKE